MPPAPRRLSLCAWRVAPWCTAVLSLLGAALFVFVSQREIVEQVTSHASDGKKFFQLFAQ